MTAYGILYQDSCLEFIQVFQILSQNVYYNQNLS